MNTFPNDLHSDTHLIDTSETPILDEITGPEDVRRLTINALPQLSDEVRQDVLRAVSQTGGHLGAGLGVVELTVALHHAYQTPRDVLIWDVSHQCYPHKILTGRRDRMTTLRTDGGLSGFTCRHESDCDPFGAAHSSTSISAALGFAAARDLSGDTHEVVAVIGDGAMSGGMAFEALNNLGAQRRRAVIVLNDNHMSIAPPSGALSDHLSELREYLPSKSERDAALNAGELKSFAPKPTMFDAFGLHYAGPFDGHDVIEVRRALELARASDGPVLLHVITEKGHGYKPAEEADDCYHGVGKFDIETGAFPKAAGSAKVAPSYTSVFAQSLIEQADRDERVVAVTAAMPSGTGLDKFAAAHPDRCFDAGIAEQHAVTFCAGLAASGMKPFAAIYSTFLQRGYDQIVHDVAIQSLPVRFAIDRAGLVGADGVTHQGSYDITYLGCLPNFVLMAPADEAELKHMVATAIEIDDRPSAFRYPRGPGLGVNLPETGEPLEIGKGRILAEGDDVAILSYGTRLEEALDAADRLFTMGYSVTVADARFAKPIDDQLVQSLITNHAVVVTLEEGAIGGFASQVRDSLSRQKLEHLAGRLAPIHLPDHFVDHGTQAQQAEKVGLTVNLIAARIADRIRTDAKATHDSVLVPGWSRAAAE